LYTNKHCDIKHIINVRFLFPFISNSATLSHSEAWPGTASCIYKSCHRHLRRPSCKQSKVVVRSPRNVCELSPKHVMLMSELNVRYNHWEYRKSLISISFQKWCPLNIRQATKCRLFIHLCAVLTNMYHMLQYIKKKFCTLTTGHIYMFLKMAKISINGIYRMLFVMQMQCDFCEVKKLMFIFNQWTQSLYKHNIHLHVIHVSVYCGHHQVHRTYTITLRSIIAPHYNDRRLCIVRINYRPILSPERTPHIKKPASVGKKRKSGHGRR
jgi:hypothetical protein